MISLALPWPPAVNNLYRNFGKKRVKTERYAVWTRSAALSVLAQGCPGIKGRFCISIECSPPDKRKRDLDGLAKAPLDLLVSCGVIEDDSLADRIILAWSDTPPAKPGALSIVIRAHGAAA
jgi:crossover junction endodeoxyribonuclease RusA